MDAFKIALETMFVGALAIPWLALTMQLFFPAAKSWLGNIPSLGGDQVRTGVAGVLLTALAYVVGAGVGRLAEDFFNDDDLRILSLRPVPENRIRESVYCSPVNSELVDPFIPCLCQSEPPRLSDTIGQIFQLEETTLLLAGPDKTDRLRRQHQQLMVLRGAAFDGVLTCILCILGLNLAQQKWKGWRYVPPGIILFGVLRMLYYHFGLDDSGVRANFLPALRHFSFLRPDDPPFAELTFLVLGLGGFYLVWKGKPGSSQYAQGFWAALPATGLAYVGWYLTEIQYDQLVMYSYHALKLSAP